MKGLLGLRLGALVRQSVDRAIHEVLRELDRQKAGFVRRSEESDTGIWWDREAHAGAV